MSKDFCLVGGTLKNDVGNKNTVLPATMSRNRVSNDRRKLEDEMNSLMIAIQQNESKLMKVNQENEDNLSNMKEILTKKDDTMEERKKVDRQLQALNDEITTKRETLVRLQGNLQYKNQEKINEAIRRLEYQLAANNYRVSEEIKIVQEIDRLKRSKKGLCQYLASKDELDALKHKMLSMRNDRDVLCRQVTIFRTNEEEIKRNLKENRTLTESLRKEIDELHSKKRKTIADLKQISLPALPLKEVLPRRTPSFKRKEENIMTATKCESTKISPQEGVRQFPRKCRSYCDPHAEHLLLCGTLVTYLQRLAVTSTPSTTPVVEQPSPIGGCAMQILEGDAVMVLHRREECSELFASKKGSKRGKKKKGHANKPLSHTPEVFVQFDKLGLVPPSTVADVATTLEALATKKESLERQSLETLRQKESPSEQTFTKPSLEPTPVIESVSDSSLEEESSKGTECLDMKRIGSNIDTPSSSIECSISDPLIFPLEIKNEEKCLTLVNGISMPNITVNLAEDEEGKEEEEFVLNKMMNGLDRIVDIEHNNVTPPPLMIPCTKSVTFSMTASGDFRSNINGGSEVVGVDINLAV